MAFTWLALREFPHIFRNKCIYVDRQLPLVSGITVLGIKYKIHLLSEAHFTRGSQVHSNIQLMCLEIENNHIKTLQKVSFFIFSHECLLSLNSNSAVDSPPLFLKTEQLKISIDWL